MLQAWTRMIKKALSLMNFMKGSAFSAKQWIPNPVQSQSPKVQPTRAGKMQKPFVFLFLHLLLIGAMPGFLPFVARAQKAEPGIMNFQAIKSGKSILIRFTVPAGRTCDGIIIRRSVEGGDFLPIREIEGICGSDSASISFSEIDELPVFNRRMQYLLQLGRSSYSDTLNSFFTETGAAGYILTRQAYGWMILLENASRELISLLVHDAQGKPILVTETRSDFFEIPFAKLTAAPVFFRLYHTKSGLIDGGKLIFTN